MCIKLFQNLNIVQIIVEMDSLTWDTNFLGPNQRTCLHHAVLGGNPLVVNCLAEYFGEQKSLTSIVSNDGITRKIPILDVQDENGWTALIFAAACG